MNDYLVEENKYLRGKLRKLEDSLFQAKKEAGVANRKSLQYREALLSIAHGDTHVAHPHDIAKWALEDEING